MAVKARNVEVNNFISQYIVHYFHVTFCNTPIEVVSNNISMFFSQMRIYRSSTVNFIGFTNQTIVNNSFVLRIVCVQFTLCWKFHITLVAFEIFDAKMHFEMSLIIIPFNISKLTITAAVQVIFMNFYMINHFLLKPTRCLTFRFRTFVPVLFFESSHMHWFVKIQTTLKMF